MSTCNEDIRQLHLLNLRKILVHMEHENQMAAREAALGGWLYNHSEAISQYADQYTSEVKAFNNRFA